MNFNQRGFMLLSAVFLTLIVSFTAMMTLQTMMRVKNGDQSLKLHAINLANEQFAMVESLAAQDRLLEVRNFNGNDEDLISYGLKEKNATDKTPVEFKVKTAISNHGGNLRKVTVTVTWKNDSSPDEIKFEKLVRVADVE